MMVSNLHHPILLPLQQTQHHNTESLQTLLNGQCILITGPLLTTYPLEGHLGTPYLTALFNGIVEWCVSKEIITQPAMVGKWRTLVKENALLRLAYSIEEYLPNKSDFQQCLHDIVFQWRTPVPEVYQFFTTYTFRGYITTTYDTFIEEAYYAQWHRPLIKLYPASFPNECPPSSLEQPFIFKPYGDKEALELVNLRRRIMREVMTREAHEQLQQVVADFPALFLGFESTDPEIQMFRDLLGQRDLFFSPFPLVEEEPHTSFRLLTKTVFTYNQLPEPHTSADFSSTPLSNASLLLQTQGDPLSSKPARTIEICISYAREDSKMLDEFRKHLRVMQRQFQRKGSTITIWASDKITAGKDTKKEIQQHFSKAQVILLLVSVDFLDSDLCYNGQLQPALDRHQSGDACVVPVILRPCHWENELFGDLQALPRDGMPVVNWPIPDNAYWDIIEGICDAIDLLPYDSA